MFDFVIGKETLFLETCLVDDQFVWFDDEHLFYSDGK